MIVNDESSVINKWRLTLTDDAEVIIYIRNMFMTQATVANGINASTAVISKWLQLATCACIVQASKLAYL